jgi:hypothetical protein
MSKQSIIAELRIARIDRILAAKQSRVLTSPWMRRTLSLVAIISSYAVLATLLIPTPYTISKTNRIYRDSELMDKNWIYDFRDTTQGIALLLLIWSFILLRISMRRVTLLPNEYLDELQIANRDWAFKTGYLVVRRIGFGVALAFGVLAVLNNQFTSFSAGNGPTPKAFRALERYVSDLSTEDPFGFYFKAFLLLAFVAYSFPLILLAWREARFPESVPDVQVKQELTPEGRKAKFYFTTLKWAGLYVGICASMAISPQVFINFGALFYILLLPLVYWVIPGSVVLFVWASVTASRGVIAARKAGFTSDLQKRWANLTTVFTTLTLVLGLIVGVLMFGALSRMWQPANSPWNYVLPFAFLAGLLMIPAQAISMTFYAKLNTGEPAKSHS